MIASLISPVYQHIHVSRKMKSQGYALARWPYDYPSFAPPPRAPLISFILSVGVLKPLPGRVEREETRKIEREENPRSKERRIRDRKKEESEIEREEDRRMIEREGI